MLSPVLNVRRKKADIPHVQLANGLLAIARLNPIIRPPHSKILAMFLGSGRDFRGGGAERLLRSAVIMDKCSPARGDPS